MRPALKKIKVGRKQITALVMPLQKKTLIVIRGSRGYVMCGYLNLKVAEKFGDAAVKITGVANINDAFRANVHSYTFAAGKLGIKKGQPVKEVLKILA